VDSCGFLWIPVDSCGFQKIYPGIHKNPQKFIETTKTLYGIVKSKKKSFWNTENSCGFQKNDPGIHRNSQEFSSSLKIIQESTGIHKFTRIHRNPLESDIFPGIL
jgi:hypothetical protein